MRLFEIGLVLGCALWDVRCCAEDRLMLDAYTKHSSDCQESYAKICGPWKQPRRLSWQHDITNSLSTDIGFGTNSYGGGSANIGGAWQPIGNDRFKAGIFASYVTGYTCVQIRTCNVIGGLIGSAQLSSVSLQLLYVPAIGDGTVSVINLRAGYSF